jgi:S1-C subfamily serine protease
MNSSPMPDPASGGTAPNLGQPSRGENGGIPGADPRPELSPSPAVARPWPASPSTASGWGPPATLPPAGSPPHWGPPLAPAGGPAAPSGRRPVGVAVGGALIAGGLMGALVMAAASNVATRPSTSSTSVPSQRVPFGNGAYSGAGGFSNPPSGATGSGSSSSGSSGLDASAIAASVDPAIVDITSYMSDGVAAGTGMVITSGGQVLTNNHVILGATRITAQIAGTGATYTATVVGDDPAADVALLQIQGVSNLRTVSTGDSSKVAASDPVVAIGNALGRGGTPAVAAGSVVAVGQTITATDDSGANAETLGNLIQVDADIQPGDSGGPLVDASGQVIGMDTAGSSSGRGFVFRGASTQGFAIPIDAAMSVAQRLRSGGGASQSTAQSALLGVQVTDASSQGATGALVVGVVPGTPAESAGLTAGDVIVSFGGTSITSAATLGSVITSSRPQDHVQVAWLDQGGQRHTATVQLAGQSAPAA